MQVSRDSVNSINKFFSIFLRIAVFKSSRVRGFHLYAQDRKYIQKKIYILRASLSEETNKYYKIMK